MTGCAGQPTLTEGCPELAAQWHPTRNEDLAPDRVTCSSNRRVWWLCTAGECGHDHAWQAKVVDRAQRSSGCPICAGRKPCTCNSLAALHPELIGREWDYEANTERPEGLLPGSYKSVHWRCSLHEPPHCWTAAPHSRVRNVTGCAWCARTSRASPPPGY